MRHDLPGWMRVRLHVNMGVAKAARFGRKTIMALGLAGVASIAIAQTVPDQQVPTTVLDLPANFQFLGKPDPNARKPTAIVNDTVITGTDVDQRMAMIIGISKLN